MIVSTNEGTLWALPFALFVPVVAWYFFAMLLTLEWTRLKCGWYMKGGRDEEEGGVYMVVTTSGQPSSKYGHPHSEHNGPNHPDFQGRDSPFRGKNQRFGHTHGQHHLKAPLQQDWQGPVVEKEIK